MTGRPLVRPDLCSGCGNCVRACPLGIVRLEDGKAAVDQNRSCMACFHCTAACPEHALAWEGLEEAELYPALPEDEVVRTVMTRRSTRHFRPDCPDRAVLQKVLNEAEYAPSSKNEHRNRWTVILGREKTDALIPYILAWGEAHGRGREMHAQLSRGRNMLTCGAPCVIIGHIPEDASNPEGDVVIAMATAELLLRREGLSACWGGYCKRTIIATPELREKLGIPADHHIGGVLLTGYADGEVYCNAAWRKPAEITWH